MQRHLVVIGCALVAAVRPLATQEMRPTPVQDSAYLVFASILDGDWARWVRQAKTLVFQEETTTYPRCVPSGKPLEDDWRPVVDNFKAATSVPHTIAPGARRMPPYVVVPLVDIRGSFSRQPGDPFGWKGFYQKFPDSVGYVEASAVGFNPSKTRALVYMGHHCGMACGDGRYYFLEKVADIWRDAPLRGVTLCGWAS